MRRRHPTQFVVVAAVITLLSACRTTVVVNPAISDRSTTADHGTNVTTTVSVPVPLTSLYDVAGSNMEPTLDPGDSVEVSTVTSVERGDIVVLKLPSGAVTNPSVGETISRVIGLPGDTIEAKSGLVHINGQQLAEPYLPAGTLTTSLPQTTVSANGYFIMGDNRSDSQDSRFFGSVPAANIEYIVSSIVAPPVAGPLLSLRVGCSSIRSPKPSLAPVTTR